MTGKSVLAAMAGKSVLVGGSHRRVGGAGQPTSTVNVGYREVCISVLAGPGAAKLPKGDGSHFSAAGASSMRFHRSSAPPSNVRVDHAG